MKILHLFLTVMVGGLMFVAFAEMPDWADPKSPASTHVSKRYIEDSYEETGHVPNMVTSVLADYRSFDTFGETTVVFTAGIAVLMLLRRREEEDI